MRATLPRLRGMPLASQIRHGDVRQESWSFRDGLAELLLQLERFLHY